MTASRFPDFLARPVDEVARLLLGCVLECEVDGRNVQVRIVETEAYDQDDEASHTYAGKTARNATMFGATGHLYVYFTYGMHYCCNIVTGRPGYGSGVLIRAVEPLVGVEFLEERRGVAGVSATNGPAKLTKALGIDRTLDGHDLHKSPIRLLEGSLRQGEVVGVSPRIGISKARDSHRRYYIVSNPYVTPHRLGR